MSKKIFENLAELTAFVGQEIQGSQWIDVTQEKINQFAQATGDHQWIHVDPERAAHGPFKTTVAHGFFTLSLLPQFFETCMAITHSKMGVNYGLNKVRFTAPVPVNSRLRASMKLLTLESLASLDSIGVQMTWQVTVWREGADKPVCIAESLVRHYQ